MALIPTFSPRVPEWRGNTSSSDMNENFSEILYDLNTIFSEATNVVIELNELESKIRHEVEAISARIYAVSGLITSYEQSASGYKMFFEEFYVPQSVVYPIGLTEDEKCVIHDEFGVVTLPVSNSFSKVYTVNIADGKTIVAPDLSVNVSALDEVGMVKLEETSPMRTFDGRDSTVWERKVRFNRDSTKSNTRCVMSVDLPSMNNPYVNNFYIKPYPEGSEDIQMVTYDTTTSKDNVLPSFPALGDNNAPARMYSFNNIQPTNFKLYFRQRISRMEDDYKTFTYGMKEIGIEKVEYKPYGKIGIMFTLPDYETGLLQLITSLRTDPDYDDRQYKVYVYPSKAEFDAHLPIWTSSNTEITPTTPLDIAVYGLDTIWVMIELTQNTSDTKSPLLRSLTMTYTTV